MITQQSEFDFQDPHERGCFYDGLHSALPIGQALSIMRGILKTDTLFYDRVQARFQVKKELADSLMIFWHKHQHASVLTEEIAIDLLSLWRIHGI